MGLDLTLDEVPQGMRGCKACCSGGSMAVRSDLCRCPPCTEPHLTGDHQVWGGGVARGEPCLRATIPARRKEGSERALGRHWAHPGCALSTCRSPWRRGFGCFGKDAHSGPGALEQPLPPPTPDLRPQAQARWRHQQQSTIFSERPAKEKPENKGCTIPLKASQVLLLSSLLSCCSGPSHPHTF